MNDKRLVNTLAQAGFKGKNLQTAYAVAKAESGGRPEAFNPDASTGDRSYGLFQINMLGSLGPARRKQFGLKRDEDLYDPLRNAKIAYRMSGGGKDWSPWSTYKSGAHEKYLNRVPQPTKGPLLPAPTNRYQPGRRSAVTPPGEDEFKIPEYKFTGGTDPTKLANALLTGMSAEKALTESTTPFEMHEIVQKTPRMPKPMAEVKARRYGGTVQDAGDAPAPNPKIAQALAIAKQQIGKPYVWAASSPGVGFDCSGLIEYAFEAAGIKTPGRLTTGPMAKMGQKVPWKQIQPGDWVVRDSGGSGHVVMYCGNGQVIAAPQTGEVVQFQPLSRFASDSRYAVRRWHGE